MALHLWKGTASITDFIQTAKTIADSLAAIDFPVSTANLVLQILSGLDLSFESFVPSITTCQDSISLE